ncbi:ADP-heptose--LPS heptosyltransferase [Vibrio albus]|uniref:ADP-heptose--LPS heptosyltransferase n=1 Tax=Vibrio albus TaxID=2200953 RepID=A0A2U3B8R8_9VIBR|nr:glycosyltransferase family 9 protein [Vibrio albus]PWI33178.1 ADP-heptose--LPS heptosyltransferase [Vibrio albus]
MQKILVVRNDKIGDFMLAWPSFAMLKQSMPDCHITALVPGYTVELAKLCPWIDDVILDPTKKGSKEQKKALITELKSKQFDASINLFSTTYNALLVWKAGIPYRLAPATKLAQIFYNHRLRQKRSQSAKPEYQYNLDLIREFLADQKVDINEPSAPYLRFESEQLAEQKKKLVTQLDICPDKRWLFVHAGTGGSANNLSLEQYADLITAIEADFELVITAGPGEEAKARELLTKVKLRNRNGVIYDKNDGLIDFTRSIACANLFMAGSTGPLHIAAALDVPTVGFFPSKRSSTPLRWLPLNSEGRHIAFAPPKGGTKEEESDMSKVDVREVLLQLNPWAAQYLS